MVNGVVIGDVHLCKKRPVCRKDDDWYDIQLGKLKEIVSITQQHKTNLYIAGDMFDNWNSGYRLVIDVNNALHGVDSYYVAGNHDLPYHNLKNFFDSPLSMLDAKPLGFDGEIAGLHFGESHAFPTPPKALIVHQSVSLNDDSPWAANTDVKQLIESEQYKNIPLIISGDFHKSFVYEHHDGRVWLNVGPVFRTSVKERLYKPSCWYFEVEGNDVAVQRHELTVDVEAVDRTEMYIQQFRDKELFAFADQLLTATTDTLDFDKSIAAVLNTNNADKPVRDMVYQCIDEARQMK